jgi:hypothetical protein
VTVAIDLNDVLRNTEDNFGGTQTAPIKPHLLDLKTATA